ncbi:hypothetical protein [Pseudohaliea rubra]|uniref:Lipoprotein n=1 Tax=Pseudohaliea rubra DSM 19751 TaxID=1265313 RepID=A0A095XZF6_9GAMM|nr:hypothetical protein [Pseudohaliea rubra]KGE05136.1 hypothetical protein HRUBRA_00338 [Pseudohaliea rubra DSM 19751]
MPGLFKITTRAAGALLLAAVAACAGGPTYNPTVFPYEIEQERLAEEPLKTVIIPHVNLGSPSRNYLEPVEPQLDSLLTRYLKDNGYEVLPQRLFRQHWNTAARAFGDPVDPTTGRVNMKTFTRLMQSVRDRLAEDTDVDAFVFTDIVELEVPFSGGLKHIARWDGVARRPTLDGPGSGVTADFDWGRPAAVASLQVTVFDMELKRVFVSRGGLDATDAVDTRSSSGGYTRRRNILENETFLQEGVRLALHPLIPWEQWPGNP